MGVGGRDYRGFHAMSLDEFQARAADVWSMHQQGGGFPLLEAKLECNMKLCLAEGPVQVSRLYSICYALLYSNFQATYRVV